MRKHFQRTGYVLATILVCLLVSIANADVVVLANRMVRPVVIRIFANGTKPVKIAIAGGATHPVPCEGPLRLSFETSQGVKRYNLDANAAYFFGRVARGEVDLQKIGLGGTATTLRGRKLPGKNDGVGVIGVVIAVDEEEAATRRVWESRLRKRIAKASMILEAHVRMRLEVVGVQTWKSNNDTTNFLKSLTEFEKAVDPFPGRLVIGFTSQYHVPKGRVHLGGTRGPLHSHILIREWSKHIGEPERLELLVHELGHYFGSAHSPEKSSVMRPVLGDRKAVRAGFRIQYDPVNTLTMNIITEEMRRRGIRQLRDLTPASKQRLRQIYGVLAKSMPKDPAPKIFKQLLNQPPKPKSKQRLIIVP